jgi:hypothetical protein
VRANVLDEVVRGEVGGHRRRRRRLLREAHLEFGAVVSRRHTRSSRTATRISRCRMFVARPRSASLCADWRLPGIWPFN